MMLDRCCKLKNAPRYALRIARTLSSFARPLDAGWSRDFLQQSWGSKFIYLFLNVEDFKHTVYGSEQGSNKEAKYSNRTMIESKSPGDFESSNEFYSRRT